MGPVEKSEQVPIWIDDRREIRACAHLDRRFVEKSGHVPIWVDDRREIWAGGKRDRHAPETVHAPIWIVISAQEIGARAHGSWAVHKKTVHMRIWIVINA